MKRGLLNKLAVPHSSLMPLSCWCRSRSSTASARYLVCSLALLEVFRAGGFTTGGFNFDSKVRRQSLDPADLFHGHVGAIDVIARGLLSAAALIEDGRLDALKKERYAGWDGELGTMIHAEGTGLADIADMAIERDLDPRHRSGQQERLENIINRVV